MTKTLLIKSLMLLTIVTLFSSCDLLRKVTSKQPGGTTTTSTTTSEGNNADDPFASLLNTVGDWQCLQTGGNISLKGGNNFSSSIQMRMERGQAIYISLRPVLGIEVGRIVITADSLYAVDKVHKRYIAEKVSILTSGIPVTVSDVQDIFLGRPFIIGKGTLRASDKSIVDVSRQGSNIVLTPNVHYKGYGYSFTFDKSNRISSFDILKEGSSTPAYQVKYGDVKSTDAGNIAHDIDVDAAVQNKKIAFSLDYKNIDWKESVSIDRSIPSGYSRMSATSLFSLFGD